MRDRYKVGSHSLHVEGDDVFVITYVGDLHGDEVVAVHDELNRRAEGMAPCFLLVDLARAGKVASDVRPRAAQSLISPSLRGIALYEGSFHLRVIGKLTIKLIRLMGKLADCPIVFVETRAAADAWIGQRRRALSAPPRRS
jgi:hypothetical protein